MEQGRPGHAPSIDRTERRPPPAEPDAPRLLVVAADGTWWSSPLPEAGSLRLGRGPEADVRIHDRSVSRLHARLDVEGPGRYRLTDLGSANGTAVGRHVFQASTVDVQPGQPMLFGRTVVVIQVPAPRPRAAAAPPARAVMATVDAQVARVAPTLVNVLLLGETGVGKDVVAERLHQQSTRRDAPLLRLNCAGLTPALLESELFGHERGAFTGALQTKKGLLEVAAGGTVFLDEIGEMPLEVQAKLLLALEQRVVRRVGATTATRIDVRFICATHRDLGAAMREQQFRPDFYYRINGVTIRIPPLRERLDELEPLVARFAREAAARQGAARVPEFHPDALRALRAHGWPGNIRELRNLVDRAFIFSDGEVVTLADLVAADLPWSAELGAPVPDRGDATYPDRERQRVVAALDQCGGNQSRAARLLGISRNTLIARIRAFGLMRPHGPGEPR